MPELFKKLTPYIGYDFESGCVITDDYRNFQKTYFYCLDKMCKKNGWKLVKKMPNHSEFSCFIQCGEQFVYMSIDDVRYFADEWHTRILIRTAVDASDYHGGRNQYTMLKDLETRLSEMFNS